MPGKTLVVLIFLGLMSGAAVYTASTIRVSDEAPLLLTSNQNIEVRYTTTYSMPTPLQPLSIGSPCISLPPALQSESAR